VSLTAHCSGLPEGWEWYLVEVLRRVAGVAVVGALVLVGCTTNSPGSAGYESRTATTAEKMVSPVATGALLAQLGGEGNLFGPYAKTATTGALDEAESVQSSFSHIQPPDERSDRIRTELARLLQRSTNELTALRIAARKGNLEALGRFERPLSRLARQLEQFQKAHER
jgi:hypothetical protein